MQVGSKTVHLKCQRCHYGWDYGGNKNYATCPNCLTKVKTGLPPKIFAKEDES